MFSIKVQQRLSHSKSSYHQKFMKMSWKSHTQLKAKGEMQFNKSCLENNYVSFMESCISKYVVVLNVGST